MYLQLADPGQSATDAYLTGQSSYVCHRRDARKKKTEAHGICTKLETLPFNFLFFSRPKYRYPYYDENGKGKLLYGYGGPELYQYKSYSPLEGIH